MSNLSISQALQALLPVARADMSPAGSRGDAGLSSLQSTAGAVERLAGQPAVEAAGLSAGMGGDLLRSLELNPIQSQLAPSIGDTLTQHVTTLTPSPADTSGAAAPQAPVSEPGAPSQTLQEMAQAAPHHDIAAERHGNANDRPVGSSSATTLDANAFMPVPAGHAETRSTPFAREVQVTPAVVSLLHTPDIHFRTGRTASTQEEEAAEQAARRQAGRDGHEDDAEHDDEDAGETDASWMSDDAPRPVAAAPASCGDPLLYQQILSALHALKASDGPVHLALEELRRQRRVVLATPAGLNSGLRCQAHVDVLWPAPGGRGGRAVRLVGELLWSQVTSDADWLEAHLIKSQGHGSVRQLVPVAAQAESRRIAVCLGAQAMPMTAWSQACLRVRDATRLWRALEPQWSLRLVIATLPLVLQGQHNPTSGANHAA